MITVEKASRWVARPSGRGGRSKVMYEAKLGDMAVDRNTAAEARTALLEQAAAALRGDYTPRVFRYSTWTAVIYRRPDGFGKDWAYQLIDDEFQGSKSLWGSSGYATAADAETSARSHIAQNALDLTDPLRGLDIIDDPDQRRQYLYDCGFQLRYRALLDADYDGRLHETAGGLDRWPEHIDKPAPLVDPLLEVAHG